MTNNDEKNPRTVMREKMTAEVYKYLMATVPHMYNDVADLQEFAEEIVDEGLQFMDNALGIYSQERSLQAKGLGDPAHQTDGKNYES